MALKFLDNIELNNLSILDQVLESLSADPGSPTEGRIIYNNTGKVVKFYNGTSWIDPTARANHTGTQLASTISNFDTQVRTSRLDQMAAPTASVSFNSQKITSLANGTNANDAVNKSQLDAAIQGITEKMTADAAATGNVAGTYSNGTAGVGATLTVTATGVLTVDGYATAQNDRVFLNNQTDPKQNGLYLVTTAGSVGVSAVLTRDVALDQSAEFKGAFILVGETSTTLNGAMYLCNQSAPVIGTDNITFTRINSVVAYTADETTLHLTGSQFSIKSTYAGQTSIVTLGTVTTGTWNATAVDVAHGGTGATDAATARTNLGATGKYAAAIGDGSSTSIVVTHNLGTRDVMVNIYNASTYERVETTVVHTSTNTITVSFAVAPTSNQYRVVVVG